MYSFLGDTDRRGSGIQVSSSIRSLLRGNSGPSAAQDEFLNLAGRRLRKLRQDGHPLRDLERRKTPACKLAEVFVRYRRTRLAHHERMRSFTPFFMRKPDDGDFHD